MNSQLNKFQHLDKKTFKETAFPSDASPSAKLPPQMNMMDQLMEQYGHEVDDGEQGEEIDITEPMDGDLDLENDEEMKKLIQQANELRERKMREKREELRKRQQKQQ